MTQPQKVLAFFSSCFGFKAHQVTVLLECHHQQCFQRQQAAILWVNLFHTFWSKVDGLVNRNLVFNKFVITTSLSDTISQLYLMLVSALNKKSKCRFRRL